jgi:transposase
MSLLGLAYGGIAVLVVRQPHIPFVPKKTVAQQDIQALHRARQRMVNHRMAVISQIRGLLLDRGLAIAKCITRARRAIPEILFDFENELTALPREAIAELYDLFRDLDRRIVSFDKKIGRVFRESEDCQRIATIKGVGPKTARRSSPPRATGRSSRTGGISPAWVGLVPRQHSCGDRKWARLCRVFQTKTFTHLRNLCKRRDSRRST